MSENLGILQGGRRPLEPIFESKRGPFSSVFLQATFSTKSEKYATATKET